MSKKSEKNLIVGLDIGTTKVVAIVCEVGADGTLSIIGEGTCPSRGMKKGVVVNLESTAGSIQRAIEAAELMAGCQINTVYVGIAGNHISSFNLQGMVAIRDKEVTQNDVSRVVDSASTLNMPSDQQIIHVIPQEYIIDKQEGIHEPIGMAGVRLETNIHLVTAASGAAQNIEKCVHRCGLEVEDLILEQLASSCAVLREDEKELGVCLVDIGGGTTDIAVFANGAIRHTAVIPIAGDQVTNDIAVALRTPTRYAEEIKVKHACALAQLADPEREIEVPAVGDRPPRILTHQILAEVVEPRYEELMQLIQAELRRSGYDDLLGAGIVLTGGSSKVEGLATLAEEVFHQPVRIGIPSHVSGLSDVVKNPIYATAVGLLLFGHQQMDQEDSMDNVKNSHGSFWAKIKNWFHGSF
ncbi:MAG: cell division protein FtsA [Gammaproteobacteria bacterium]|nr:cell division protein FtsA [Gammaproteobacteria bacterium]